MHLIFHFANSSTHILSRSRDAFWQMCPSEIELTLDTAVNSLFICLISHNEKSIKCHHCIIKNEIQYLKSLRGKDTEVKITNSSYNLWLNQTLHWYPYLIYLSLLLNCHSMNESKRLWLNESQEAVASQIGKGNIYIECF